MIIDSSYKKIFILEHIVAGILLAVSLFAGIIPLVLAIIYELGAWLVWCLNRRNFKDLERLRRNIKKLRPVLFEGRAMLDNNQGWIFVTKYAVEFYTQKETATCENMAIKYSQIRKIYRDGKKLVIQTSACEFSFVVPKIDLWIFQFKKIQPKKML